MDWREMSQRIRWPVIALVVLGIAGARASRADLELEQTGQVASLPQPPSPHWAWVGDPVQRRSVLVDLEDGRMLGNLAGGEGLPGALFPRTRRELYMPRTHHSRGDHGERVDALIFFDSTLLTPMGEVILPPKRAILAFTSGGSALSDDDRFAAVFNLTPATSISIVDLEARTFVEEVSTPGCSLVYAAGDRRFAMLCGNGALLLVTLDEAGRAVEKTRSVPFFDPVKDPVTEKAARWGDTWLFASFEGYLYSVDLSGAEPRFSEPWSLLSEADREASWRIGGTRHLAVHQATGRLYSLVHQGGPDTHKDAGSELWVYDLASRAGDFSAHYTDQGILPTSTMVEIYGNKVYASLHIIASGSHVAEALVFTLQALAAVALLVGYRTRLATALCWCRSRRVGRAASPHRP